MNRQPIVVKTKLWAKNVPLELGSQGDYMYNDFISRLMDFYQENEGDNIDSTRK